MPNFVNYFEIGTPNAGATTAFYGDLFGWSIGEPSDGYRMIEGDKGGVCDTTSVRGGSWAIFYVQVDDVKTVIDKASWRDRGRAIHRQQRPRIRPPAGPVG